MSAPPAASKPPAPWTPPTTPPTRYAGDGLIIRAYEHSDAEALFSAIEASRATLTPWIPWALTDNRTLGEVTYNIERFRRAASQRLDAAANAAFGYSFGIFDGTGGDFLGGIALIRIGLDTHNAEVGYWLRQDRRGRGICTRALAAMISWAFTPQASGGFGFRRIHLFAAALNTASCAVPRRLGLHQCTHARRDRWLEGLGWCDTFGWDALAEEWDTERRAMVAAT